MYRLYRRISCLEALLCFKRVNVVQTQKPINILLVSVYRRISCLEALLCFKRVNVVQTQKPINILLVSVYRRISCLEALLCFKRVNVVQTQKPINILLVSCGLWNTAVVDGLLKSVVLEGTTLGGQNSSHGSSHDCAWSRERHRAWEHAARSKKTRWSSDGLIRCFLKCTARVQGSI